METAQYILLFFAGTFAGAVNTVAGGGGMLVLPLMIFLGIPSPIANGTYRVAIVFQNLTNLSVFIRNKMFPGYLTLFLAVPALIGCWFGSGLAVEVEAKSFNRILGLIMFVVVGLMMLKPSKSAVLLTPWRLLLGAICFAGIGFYGGFIQAGVGFIIILLTMKIFGLGIVQTNALKSAVVLIYTFLALYRFESAGKVVWSLAIPIALGNMTGAFLGARYAVAYPEKVRKAVLVLGVLFGIKLILDSLF